MHLQVAPIVGIDDGSGARDLEQPTADIVVLSAADSELASLAGAIGRRPDGAPSVAVTNFLALGHPLSIDLYVERTLARARIIALRLLGGDGYWPYGIDSLRRLALRRRIPFVCLPGDTRWDGAFAARGTVPEAAARELWRYLAEGGDENADGALAWLAHAIGRGPSPPPPRPIPAAGAWPSLRPSHGRPKALVVFYRALIQGGMTEPIEALAAALEARGIAAQPVFVASLKDEVSAQTLAALCADDPPDIVLNVTAFAVGSVGERPDSAGSAIPGAPDCPVIQVALAGTSEEAWRVSARGLTPRDLAMNVVLPEVDGRIFGQAIAFREPVAIGPGLATMRLRSLPDRIEAAAALASAWVRLRRTQPGDRRVALVVANYPNRDGRLANGVGLDTPASCIAIVEAMREAGYATEGWPIDAASLMRLLTDGPTNDLRGRQDREGGIAWPVSAYEAAFAALPPGFRDRIDARWGRPADDPHVADGAFRMGLHVLGNTVVGIQPARGYNIDPKETYHAPDLAPPHHYVAFYLWLRTAFDAHAVIHVGKHGNLEWLPGKSAGLSAECAPAAILGPLPNIYPFIVNDPGEGIQAKRRSGAVIVDHLTPPLARAELHDDLAALERLVDEYALAADLDPRRAASLASDIAATVSAMRLDADLGLAPDAEPGELLRSLDAHLCDLKEMQIRDGLHVFGSAPEGPLRDALLVAIARLTRSELRPEDASLHRALAADLGLDGFDPLGRDLGTAYAGPRPPALADLSDAPWRIAGDTVERIEHLASELVSGRRGHDPAWTRTRPVLGWIGEVLRPRLARSGAAEIAAVLAALDGRFVAPGPSGAPSRGRPDVLPTGRNFFAVDTRAVPSEAAWRTGRLAAEELVRRYVQDEGEWPKAVALSVWGTANMRTGGDDIAQALALIGASPVWEPGSGRVTGFQVMDAMALQRPRVDVTLRMSGLFRDAFPTQIDLFDSAIRAIASLDEDDDQNPIAARVRRDAAILAASGLDAAAAQDRAAIRVFGSQPGAYGAGLQALIDEGGWDTRSELAESYLAWGGFAYGNGRDGAGDAAMLRERLKAVDAVVQAQDNREHDILDSDDYYQFMGGLAATVESLTGKAPPVLHLDASRPEAPIAGRSGPRSPAWCGGGPPIRNGSRASCGTATRAPSRSPPRSITCSASRRRRMS